MSAYLLRVEDNEMADGSRPIEKGDWVLVDPAREVRRGNIVHAIDPSTGRDIIREIDLLPIEADGVQRFRLSGTSKTAQTLAGLLNASNMIRGVVVERRILFP